MAKTAVDYINDAFKEVINDDKTVVDISGNGIITMVAGNDLTTENKLETIKKYTNTLGYNIVSIKKKLINKDEDLKKYAAYVYVFSCLKHFHDILKEQRFREIYMKTIVDAQEAGVEPFY